MSAGKSSFATLWVCLIASLMVANGSHSQEPPPTATFPATPKSEDTFVKSGKMYVNSFDFQNVDIEEVVRVVSKITNKNFVYGDQVKGKITIIGPKGITVDEAYQAFLSALEIRGFATVQEGKVVKIVRANEAKGQPVATSLSKSPFGDSFSTRIIPIQYVSAKDINNVINKLLTSNGNAMVYEPTNILIVTDYNRNIQKVLDIIEKIDTRGYEEKLVILPIKYATAKEMAENLKTLYGTGKGSPKDATKGPEGEFTPQPAEIIPYERTNSLIIIATEFTIAKMKELINLLDVPESMEKPKGNFHVHKLEHADSEKLSQTLQSLISGGSRGPRPPRPPGMPGESGSLTELEGDVKIVSDKPTNSLIIIASAPDYRVLAEVIKSLDVQRKQVFVEAAILEVTLGSGYQIGGIAGNAAHDLGQSFGNFFASSFGGFGSGISDPLTLTGLSLGFFSNDKTTITVPGGSDLTVPVVGAIIQLAANNSNINVISTPHILTTDNEEAEISVGANVPFVTGNTLSATGQPVIQVTREDVAVRLKIKPQISSSNYVTLVVEQEVEELLPGQSAEILTQVGPSTSSRHAKTTVVVKDQQTIVIGGLIGDKETKTVSKVPILGDIPILGWLFRKTISEKVKTNLVLFLTPYVIDDTSDMQNLFFKKVQERERFIKKYGFKDKEYMKDLKYNVEHLPNTSSISPVETPTTQPSPVEENKGDQK